MTKLIEIFELLGLNENNGLFITKEDKWKKNTAFPNRVKRLIERKLEPDAFFSFDNKPLILFFNNPVYEVQLHKAVWNFNECPILIITQASSVTIFNGFNYLKDSQSLEKIGGAEKLNDFTYFQLVTGHSWEQYFDFFNYKNRVDYHLLANIKVARKLLVEKLKLNSKIANAIIGKSIFTRYLIDRKVKMKFDDKLRTWSNDEFCELLNYPKKIQSFFDYLEDQERGFNGDLFPLSLSEYREVSKEHYQVIRRLLQGEQIEQGQASLFQLYDFSIIPIEFISNVYELFIGQDNQKKEGAYYTPLFLVDYILKETVEKKINYESATISCKVLDPACGSGIFLVETLRKVIEKYINETDVEIKSEKFKRAIKNLAQENVFGIDKDLSAVQVAIFSIYLTLLDYLEPPGIETFQFPNLLNTNFFQGDFFDQASLYNNKLDGLQFDFILGNPPWKGNGMDSVGQKYLKSRKKKEKTENRKYAIAINNNEIAEAFILRASDFASSSTRIGFIVRSSSLYNLGYKDDYSSFRQYWLEEFFIDKVFELGPVRYEVFEKSNQPAVAPAAILFYRYAHGALTDDNMVEHIALKESTFFSLFKIFTLNRTDYKRIQQKKLKEYDWLWKVLVYGSYLDFDFIKRIKETFQTIKAITSDDKKFVVSTGLHSRTKALKKPKDLSSVENLPFLKTDAVKSFYIDHDNTDVLEKDKVDIVKDVRIYRAPMLLIREGIDMNSLTAKGGISKKDALFKGSITSIKVLNGSGLGVIKTIAATFSSSLFSYYSINLFTTIGIERERVTNYNKFSLPFLDIDVSESVGSIEKSAKQIYTERKKALQDTIKIQSLQSEIKNQLDNINSKIYNEITITNQEAALIEYALNINRTLIIGSDSERRKLFAPIELGAKYLNEYASLFIERFKRKLGTKEKQFGVEIWHTKQIIGMFFKIIPKSENGDNISWINKENSDTEILSLLTKLGSEKITDRLFLQKDVRGFEKDFFFVFKPNEKRLWHKAVGYLDVNEFADAILKSGGKER